MCPNPPQRSVTQKEADIERTTATQRNLSPVSLPLPPGPRRLSPSCSSVLWVLWHKIIAAQILFFSCVLKALETNSHAGHFCQFIFNSKSATLCFSLLTSCGLASCFLSKVIINRYHCQKSFFVPGGTFN